LLTRVGKSDADKLGFSGKIRNLKQRKKNEEYRHETVIFSIILV